jgi:probable HAF family extracellular repeat protein
MTLNITIVSPSGIHQSADFRISRTEKDPNGNWIELEPNAPKIVALKYKNWHGFLTYCGIGLWRGKRTDQYAVEWIADLANWDATFRDVVERIREQGSTWIRDINSEFAEPFGHTFVLAGFEERVPIYATVSNVETLTGFVLPVRPGLVEDVRATKDTHLLITGIPNAVSQASRIRLRAVARTGVPTNVVRHELAEANRTASRSAEAKNGISPACLAYSIDMHGGGHGEVHGDIQGPLMPRTMFHGTDISSLPDPVRKLLAGGTFVQSADATTESSQADLQGRIECKPEFQENERYTVREIGALNDYTLSIQAINEKEWLVGQHNLPGAPFHAFVWAPDREIRDLGTFGGLFSHAFSVNDKNQVVGSAHVDHQVNHAFLWDESGGMRDLGTLGGIGSMARDINNREQVAGESFVEAAEPKHGAERAFFWSANDGMINIGKLFESWSRAFAINDHGVVVGWRQRGPVVCGFVWSQEHGPIDIVGPNGRHFYPCAINDRGLVIGEGFDAVGQRRTFAWTLDTGLKQLAAPDEFHPSDVDAEGNVLGNIHSRPWQQPGIYDMAEKKYFALPSAYSHQTSVKAMNQNGVIIGAAHSGSSRHNHPLIWRPTRR